MEKETPLFSLSVLIMMCGFVSRSLKKGSCVFPALPLILGGKIAQRPAYVEWMFLFEIITNLLMEVKC